MSCSLENLYLYLDGELSPGEHEKMDTHLAQCPSCRAALAELEKEHALLAADIEDLLEAWADTAPAASSLAQIVLQELPQEAPQPAATLGMKHIFIWLALLAPGAGLFYLLAAWVMARASIYSLWNTALETVVWLLSGGYNRVNDFVFGPLQSVAWVSSLALLVFFYLYIKGSLNWLPQNKNGGI